MAVASPCEGATVLLCLTFEDCSYGIVKQQIKPVGKNDTVEAVFEYVHGTANLDTNDITCTSLADLAWRDKIPVHLSCCIAELYQLGIKRLNFSCTTIAAIDVIEEPSGTASINAFDLLMSKKRKYAAHKTSRTALLNAPNWMINLQVKKCKKMNDLRSHPELKEKWQESITPLQGILKGRFGRLALKDDPFRCVDPVTGESIHNLQRHLLELFPDLNLNKLQKVHKKKRVAYTDWSKKHARERKYTFQLQKCIHVSCRLSPQLDREKLDWLPDPVLDQDREHFKSYQDVRGKDTAEDDLPSLQQTKKKMEKKKKTKTQEETHIPEPDVGVQEEIPGPLHQTGDETEGFTTPDGPIQSVAAQDGDGRETASTSQQSYTAQCARLTVTCVECRKPRVIYSQHQLSERHKVDLVLAMTEYDYTCGAPILEPQHYLVAKAYCRPGLECAQPMEIPYYSANVGRKDLCGLCGTEEAQVPPELKKSYKTVLPLCAECEGLGKVPPVQRPYGAKTKTKR